jgi:hypothetical protein
VGEQSVQEPGTANAKKNKAKQEKKEEEDEKDETKKKQHKRTGILSCEITLHCLLIRNI